MRMTSQPSMSAKPMRTNNARQSPNDKLHWGDLAAGGQNFFGAPKSWPDRP
jgi:hypothetical protein